MALVFKTSVANFAALPAVGNTDGDLRRVADTGLAYRWDEDSTTWVAYTTVPALETSDAIGLVGALTSDVDALASETGDISSVVAGTGLTGGGTSGAVTLNVDVGTTANKIVQLDGTAKLPAVDGSQLTNLPASGDITEVTAGTGLTGGGTSGAVTLNVDVGTTASKIVQLDGTAKLPAVDGSQLTNLAAPANAVTFEEFTYDFGVSGGAQGTFTLGTVPDNHMIVDLLVVVLTTFASATDAATVSFGSAGEPEIIPQSPPSNYTTASSQMYSNSQVFKVSGGNGAVDMIVGGEDLTAGKCRVIVASVPFTP